MPSDDREGYMKAIKRATNLTDAQYDVLEILVPEDIEAMEGIELSKTTFWVFGIGSLILMIMVLFSIVDTKKLGDSLRPVVYFKESHSWLRSIQWNFRNLPMTTTIIGINLLVFLTGVYQGVHFFFPSGDELFRFGAATQDSLLSENYWQILSSFFVHAGLIHILYNMVALYCVAAFIEQKLKSFLFVIVYLLSGIFAVLITLYLGDNVILVGASGAVFGLLGIMLAFLLFNIFEKESRTLVMFCLIFFGGISLVIGFFTPNVANIAHLSGLAFGFAFGSLYALIAKLR
jgi:rhomboid protease GluP